MDVHDARHILPGRMNAAVNREAGRIDFVGRVHDLPAAEIDLDERGSRDFLEQHAVGIDQKMMLRSGNPRRHVSEDEVIPAVERNQPIRGREIHAYVPFGGADLPSHRGGRFVFHSVRRLRRAGCPDDPADDDRGADQQAAARRLHEQP